MKIHHFFVKTFVFVNEDITMKNSRVIVVLCSICSMLWSGSSSSQAQTDYLIIPKLGLVEVVGVVPLVGREWDTSGLLYGVGYIEQAQYTNRIVIAGHNPGAFSNLVELVPGDEIWLLGAVEQKYRVVNNVWVDDGGLWAIRESQTPLLTLIGCYAGGRLLVNAVKV